MELAINVGFIIWIMSFFGSAILFFQQRIIRNSIRNLLFLSLPGFVMACVYLFLKESPSTLPHENYIYVYFFTHYYYLLPICLLNGFIMNTIAKKLTKKVKRMPEEKREKIQFIAFWIFLFLFALFFYFFL